MTLTRWLQIKRVYKLNCNATSKKRNQNGYDPAYKYDMIYKTIIHNVNALTKYAELDYVGDETTFAFGGYGEKDYGLINSNFHKPNVPRGGQLVLITDVSRFCPRAYFHIQNLHPKYQTKGWPQGPNEVRLILEQMEGLIRGNPRMQGLKQIYREYPHGTWEFLFR